MSYHNNPDWYPDAFDKFPPVLDELVKRDTVIANGYDLPDADGAKSSIDYKYTSTNNTFGQDAIRSSLKDLYLNSSHKLMANSHDNSHFFRWEGTFADFKRCDNLSQWYQLTLPWDIFIYQEARDRFKWSQFYHRWITVEELMNNGSVFKWALMVFVDRRVAANYEVWVEEQSITFRIRVASDWTRTKLPVYIYRFDTGYQARIKVNYRELVNQFKWDYPLANLSDPAKGLERMIMTFNLVLDETDDAIAVPDRVISETLGDNMEFIQVDPIKPVINIGQITPTNVNYLMSKPDSMFWMTIISPKFFHEYPVLLCSDVIYRPWLPSMEPLMTLRQNIPYKVKVDTKQDVTITDRQVPVKHALRDENGKLVWTEVPVLDEDGNPVLDIFGKPVIRRDKTIADEFRLDRRIDLVYPHPSIMDNEISQVYIDRNNHLVDDYDGWVTVTRPVVLSDAFTTTTEPYDIIRTEIEVMTFDLINFAKTTDEFSQYIDNESRKNAENWLKWMSLLEAHGNTVRAAYVEWHGRRQCPRDPLIASEFDTYFQYVKDIRGTGSIDDPDYMPWDNVSKLPSAWYTNVRRILSMCRDLFKRYPLVDIIDTLPRKLLWYTKNEFEGMQRFNRPVDASDFLIMEYDQKRQVWRPKAMTVTHHFPDVYTITAAANETADPNGIYKAFFFYSDTPNVISPVKTPEESKPQYDEELAEQQSKLGDFKQIFIEKFYWLAMKSLYPGLMVTDSRWEVIEYVLGNDSYRRFNELFLKSVDPYFKLGLATYLNGTHTEFPFDDAIAKLKEQLKLKWQGYGKVTSFEYYLRAQWEAVYFDYLKTITNATDLTAIVRKRPPVTFSLNQLIDELQSIHAHISFDVETALQWTLSTKILPSEGGIVESDATDVSVNAYRTKLDWVIDELSKERYGLQLDQIRYLSMILNGLPNGLERVIRYLADRDPSVYSLGEIMTIVPWLDSFDLAVEETGSVLSKVDSDMTAHDVWGTKLNVVSIAAITVSGSLRAMIYNTIAEMAKLDVNDLNRVIDMAPYSSEPDTTSLLAIMRTFDYPWSEEVRTVYESIGTTLQSINQLYIPKQTLTKEQIVAYHTAVNGLVDNMASLRHEVDRYWITNHRVPEPMVMAALAVADDVVGVFSYAIGEYQIFMRSIDALSEKMIRDITGITDIISKTELEQFVDPTKLHVGQIIEWLSQIWTVPAEADIGHSLDAMRDIFQNWKLYIARERKVFEVLADTVCTPELMSHLRSQVAIIKLIVDYLRTLPTSFTSDTTIPSYTTDFTVKRLDIDSPGGLYSVGETVHILQIGSVQVLAVDALGGVTEISGPIYVNSQFRDPMDVDRYRTISEGRGLGLVVRCSDVEVSHMIDHRLASSVITELRVTARNLNDFAKSINPTTNGELMKLLSRIESVQRKLEILEKFYEFNITDELKSDLKSAMNAFVSVPVVAFVENRSSIDIRALLGALLPLINELDAVHISSRTITAVHDELFRYFGYGTSWSDRARLIEICNDINAAISDIISTPEVPNHILDMLARITDQIASITSSIAKFDVLADDVHAMAAAIISPISHYDLNNPTINVSSRMTFIEVANPGELYMPGDLVRVVSHDATYIFIIKSADAGHVIRVEPIMDYSLANGTWDCLLTESCGEIGSGHSLTITIRSEKLDLSTMIPPSGNLETSASTISNHESNVMMDATISTAESTRQFDELDLAMFKFNNTHDLDMNYEVFLGGRQITDFYQRHVSDDDVGYTAKLDRIYIDANLVDALRTSSITITPENHFVYRIHGLVITDPGTGYYVGQQIYLNANEVCLKLNVVAVEGNPLKGLGEIALAGGEYIFEGTDPGGVRLSVVPDDMCNIDDEFHVGMYDKLTRSGVMKPILLHATTPTFLEHRPNTVNNGRVQPDVDDRNATFMYPGVGKPIAPFPPTDLTLTISPRVLESDGGSVDAISTSSDDPVDPNDLRGDHEFGWYQGHRIDNSETGQIASRWDGIADSAEVTGGVLGDIDRQPHDQPPRGEYQLIGRCRLHGQAMRSLDPRDDPSRLCQFDADHIVDRIEDLPRHPNDISEDDYIGIVAVGETVLVWSDETHDDCSWLYRVREMSPTGAYRYDDGTIYDTHRNTFRVNWMTDDSVADLPGVRYQYPDIDYHDGIRTWYGGVEIPILRDAATKNPDMFPKRLCGSTYIHDLTVDDLAVFNVTERRWEDLHDENTWRLYVYNEYDDTVEESEDETIVKYNWGFELEYIRSVDPSYSHDFKFYLCKVPRNQSLAQSLVRPAAIDVIASIDHEEIIDAQRLPVNTSRGVRIRKLFPYRQSQAIGFLPDSDLPKHRGRMTRGILSPEGTKFFNFESSTKFLPPEGGHLEMEVNMIPCSVGTLYFTLAQYMHYRNQIHLGDLKMFNHTTGQFENLLDSDRWQVDIGSNVDEVEELVISNYDAIPKTVRESGGTTDLRVDVSRQTRSHMETQTHVSATVIVDPGRGFEHGFVWGYNRSHDLHMYGTVTSDETGDGQLLTFRATHFPVTPNAGSYTFEVYQRHEHGVDTAAKVTVEFLTETVEVLDDGYLNAVLNPMAPIRHNVRITPKQPPTAFTIYELFVDLTTKRFVYLNPTWCVNPTINIGEWQCPENRWYVLVDGIRFPLVNPSTGKHTLRVTEHQDGVDVTFVNVSRAHEKLEFRTLPYPIRSVYTQRKLPRHGYLDLAGKLNKPLSRSYYEFWVNGKLLEDEVTIVSPTKLFLHGLTSLKNFEIVELNRDPHEYFSDTFLRVHEPPSNSRLYPLYDLKTYLDGALEGERMGDEAFDIYKLNEQASLLEPVWPQVVREHPEYRNYPENVDYEPDILVRMFQEDLPLPDNLPSDSYELMVLDGPKLEGIELTARGMKFDDFKLKPIDDNWIIDMLNEEWAKEIISDPYLREHFLRNDSEIYGRTTRLYNEFGEPVKSLAESYYHITDRNHLLSVSIPSKEIRMHISPNEIDLDQPNDNDYHVSPNH